MAKITKRFVDGLRGEDIGRIIRDDELAGVGVRRNADGSATYLVEYRAGQGRGFPTRRLSLGRHGALTPDQARSEAKQVLARRPRRGSGSGALGPKERADGPRRASPRARAALEAEAQAEYREGVRRDGPPYPYHGVRSRATAGTHASPGPGVAREARTSPARREPQARRASECLLGRTTSRLRRQWRAGR
jgi:hypothetical protein